MLKRCCYGVGPVVPGPAEDVSVSEVTNGSCTLTWNAPQYDGGSAVIGYYVYRLIKSSWSRINSTPIPERSVSIDLLQTSSEHEFHVCAVNAVGEGPPSESVWAFLTEPEPEPGNYRLHCSSS